MATQVNPSNIQGDILYVAIPCCKAIPTILTLVFISGLGLPKKVETFIFFQITDAKNFIENLKELAPLIKTTEQVLQDRDDIDKHKKSGKGGLIVMSGVNIALSYTGLRAVSDIFYS